MGFFDSMMGVEREPRNMDHPFIHKTEDKFNNKTTLTYWYGISNAKPGSIRSNLSMCWTNYSPIGTFNLRMRHVKTGEIGLFLLDYGYIDNKDWFHVRNGTLIVNIETTNEPVNIKLQPTETGTNVRDGGNISEWGYYEITKHQMKQIADGNKIEIRVSGDNTYFDVASKVDSLDDGESFQFMMRAFFNNLVDRDAYTDVLNPKVEEIKNYAAWKSTSVTTGGGKSTSRTTGNGGVTTGTTNTTGNEWYNNNAILFILLIFFFPAAVYGYLKQKGKI
jgi:hypothetical protein